MWVTNHIVSVVLIGFATFYAAAGWSLETWTNHAPGGGLIPRILAVALAVLAIFIWLESKPPAKSQEKAETYSKREPLIIFLLVLAYVFVMPKLGFPISTLLLIVLLRRLLEPRAWWSDLAGAVVTVGIIQVVFVHILALQLPALPVWWDK